METPRGRSPMWYGARRADSREPDLLGHRGFFEVYNTLGFGFLEHLYVLALERELLARGHRVGREVWATVLYKGEELGKQRLDMVVDEILVVEMKSTHDLPQGRHPPALQLPSRHEPGSRPPPPLRIRAAVLPRDLP